MTAPVLGHTTMRVPCRKLHLKKSVPCPQLFSPVACYERGVLKLQADMIMTLRSLHLVHWVNRLHLSPLFEVLLNTLVTKLPISHTLDPTVA